LKRREGTTFYMEILAALSEEARGPTRLAQACNVNYARIQNFTAPLEAKGLIRRESRDGQEVFVITEQGYALYRDWLEVWRRLPL
jgi:predicted transcriptional regulator